MLEILQASGLKFTFLRDEWCCRSPLFWTGQVKLAEECARHNVEEFERTGASIVVTSCAGCYRMLKEIYSERFGPEFDAEVLHAPSSFWDS